MFKKLLLILFLILYCFTQGKAQNNSIIGSKTFDDLFKNIPYVPNGRDTVFLYEKLIDNKIASAEIKIKKSTDSLIDTNAKKDFLNSLQYTKDNYKKEIERKVNLFVLSYAGAVSSAFSVKWIFSSDLYVYFLKEEYFYVSSIVDNALANFLLY